MFLDHVVTSTFVFEGEGRVQEYVGGYEDWIRQRAVPAAPSRTKGGGDARRADGDATGGTARKKLSFKEQREFERLPAEIEALEDEQRALEARMAGADFYKEGAQSIAAALARQAEIAGALSAAYARWDELDSRPR